MFLHACRVSLILPLIFFILRIRPVHIIGIFLRLFFIAVGFYFLFGPHVLRNWAIETQRIIGGLLIGYGIFRAWMSWRQIQSENQTSEGDE